MNINRKTVKNKKTHVFRLNLIDQATTGELLESGRNSRTLRALVVLLFTLCCLLTTKIGWLDFEFILANILTILDIATQSGTTKNVNL